MPELTLTLETDPNPKDIRILDDGLDEYNLRFSPMDHQPLAVFLRDSEGQVVGGLYGGTYWGWLYIKYLWIAEEYRARGYGQRLVVIAEEEAVRRGCNRSHLDTFGFQALPFYRQLGYEVYGVLEDCPPGDRRYYLQKRDLASPARAPDSRAGPSPVP